MKERKLQEIGKSLLVTVPKNWADALKLKKGSQVHMSITDTGALLIAPEFAARAEKKKSTIPFDASGERRFFREYFSGAEQVTLVLKGRSQQEARSFLRTFMNVQVVEDSKEKIVAKCLPAGDFTIDDCLARMHDLSMSLFDDVARNAPASAREGTEESLTKFYYLLIMQVRRFLGEGKFARANISLIRAMDARMAAERIERIADVLKRLQAKSWEVRELQDVRKFYAQAFHCFHNNDFDSAVPLWAYERELRKRVQSPHALGILRLAKELSALVR